MTRNNSNENDFQLQFLSELSNLYKHIQKLDIVQLLTSTGGGKPCEDTYRSGQAKLVSRHQENMRGERTVILRSECPHQRIVPSSLTQRKVTIPLDNTSVLHAESHSCPKHSQQMEQRGQESLLENKVLFQLIWC